MYIDGCDISKVALRSLRRQMGLVPQGRSCSVSVGENIVRQSPAGMKDIIKAAKLANALDFIMSFL